MLTPTTITESAKIALYSLNSGQNLLRRICTHLDLEPGRHDEKRFADGEFIISPHDSLRDKDVFLVQSIYDSPEESVHDCLLKTLFFSGALHDAGAHRLTLIIPYLAYSRADARQEDYDPIPTRYTAQLFEALGPDFIFTVDVHNRSAFDNAFRIPTVHLSAAHLFIESLDEHIGPDEALVISPDTGGTKRAERFRKLLEDRLGRPVGSGFIEKFRQDGLIRGGTVVGDVQGKIVVLIDDMISTGSTLERATKACIAQGAKAVFAAATHGIFAKEAFELLAHSGLERLLVTDTIPIDQKKSSLLGDKLQTLDISYDLAVAIAAHHRG